VGRGLGNVRSDDRRLSDQRAGDGLYSPEKPAVVDGLLGRGSQYASFDYQAFLAKRDFVCRMSRQANCWDKARKIFTILSGYRDITIYG